MRPCASSALPALQFPLKPSDGGLDASEERQGLRSELTESLTMTDQLDLHKMLGVKSYTVHGNLHWSKSEQVWKDFAN